MFTYRILDKLLHTFIRTGRLTVVYPGSTRRDYGTGDYQLTIRIRSYRAIRAILLHGTVGFGDAYSKGDILVDADELPLLPRLAADNRKCIPPVLLRLLLWLPNSPNHHRRQSRQISHHYDIGNDIYQLMLGPDVMTYSCGIYPHSYATLAEAQDEKHRLVGAKLGLAAWQTPGSPPFRVLDIGCGWGSAAIYMASHYAVEVVGITLSREQYALAIQRVHDAGLEDRVTILLISYQDYAATVEAGSFEAIYSIGMFEHVGRRNQADYWAAVQRLLVPGGVSLLHTITKQTESRVNAWMDRRIFPGGYIPSIRQLVAALPDYGLRLVHAESYGPHYGRTIRDWRGNFVAHLDTIRAMKSSDGHRLYSDEFLRTQELYFGLCEGGFDYTQLDLTQVVFTKGYNHRLSTPLHLVRQRARS
jgi:cyclopropane-fatty-acyl-phospholipid synthase